MLLLMFVFLLLVVVYKTAIRIEEAKDNVNVIKLIDKI